MTDRSLRIEVAAQAMMRHMFAPHELPLDAQLAEKYRECAAAALDAADLADSAERSSVTEGTK